MVQFIGGVVVGFVGGTMYSTKKLGHEYNELVKVTFEDAKKIKSKVSDKVDDIKSKLQKDLKESEETTNDDSVEAVTDNKGE